MQRDAQYRFYESENRNAVFSLQHSVLLTVSVYSTGINNCGGGGYEPSVRKVFVGVCMMYTYLHVAALK
jgi:hypothetical protein